MKNIKGTKMLTKYTLHLILRIIVFTLTLLTYITNKQNLIKYTTQNILIGITPLHILWLFLMITMISHIFPYKELSMAMRKAITKVDEPVNNINEVELYRFIQDQNIKAWKVMLLWISVNAIFGLLYLLNIISDAELILLTVFYFLCDYICILIFCPFQRFIMKNKCCVNCRIYDWGHFMMFTPMLFIRNFFSWSLFFTSLIVLIRWEILYAKHQERFYSGVNSNMKCQNCKEKLCTYKRKLRS